MSISASLLAARRPQVILFDVNETLLDLSPLRRAVGEAFGAKTAFNQWFGLLLQHSLVANETDSYFHFSTIADAALDMTANMLQAKPLSLAQKHDILTLFTQLPAHPDVPAALAQLQTAGYRLFTLTNSAPLALAAQLRYAGLTDYFEQSLSIDPVRLYKPHPASYHYAAQQAGVAPAEALLVAAHGWDVAGALHAGLGAAFLARPGQTLYPLAPMPTYQAATLKALADQLLSLG